MPFIETNDRTQLFYTDGGSGRPLVFVASASQFTDVGVPDPASRCSSLSMHRVRPSWTRPLGLAMERLRLRHACR
jgi:hypothetical protein